jgi:ABC-2 type transport system ATP-binding protein
VRHRSRQQSRQGTPEHCLSSENVALYEHLSAVENADYLLALSGGRQTLGPIKDALLAAGLQEQAWDQRLRGFSKGMRQKVAIAVALLRQVPVLLLDKPTSGLDPRATADFNKILLQVCAYRKTL